MLSDRFWARVTMLLPDAGVRLSGRWQSTLYRLTGGRLGGRWAGSPVLVLTTTGRRSGQQRATPVLYIKDGENVVVIGSNTGSERPPAWALNLVANSAAEVQIGRGRHRVDASVAEGSERVRLWGMMNQEYQGFDMYRERTDRDIKVFVLRPA